MQRKLNGTCKKCSALCCKYFALEIDKPSTRNDFENIRWYISHQKTSVFIQKGKWFLNVKNRCKHLDDGSRCTVYAHRPAICRRLDSNGCEYHDKHAVREIRTPQQLEAYLGERSAKRTGRRKS
jgi:Fe-S-cluster containining protein